MSIEQVEIMEGIKGKILSVKVLLQEQREQNRELSVLNEALACFPKPEIFNTDQGSQYTSKVHIGILRVF